METVKSMLGAGGGGGGGGDGEDTPQIPKDGDMPSREEMLKTIESLQKAQKAQSTANSLKQKAMAMASSTQREKLLKEAFDKEMEANGHSKMAKRMQSGTWQGFGFGGGIGAASGLGLGAGVGTVLGAILSVPATGLGMLVGTGVGAIHGPWIKLGGGKDGKVEEVPFEDADPGRVVDALEAERKAQLEKGAAPESAESTNGAEKPRRKPPKLEIRSKKGADANKNQDTAGEGAVKKESEVDKGPSVNSGVSEESKPPRQKPKKLEIRSGKDGQKPATAKA
ncbi:hypothetical protein G647_03832 [Cladophialophora carrionii CBS 160.54]|uniref:Uncharacterized protein n=1 Tax=Cladophialophora carrionii CBS 160.54 TaxID=1279043 RepID=V9DDS0_9EURO|nr:uncharacterized protein G647_03832 [Cladophialophora carrionii CBS 160.54]ETI24463.1 hypothetical protein G647_03832 [Cladophialophora carrionii CBS 160.54]